MLGWHNPVYNASNTRQIATDNGYCVRTVAIGKTEWECAWTTLLPGGQITVEGPYYDDGTDTTLAITGGTGRYTGPRAPCCSMPQATQSDPSTTSSSP